MSKMQIIRDSNYKWVLFSELQHGDLFALNTTSDIFQRINLDSTEKGNCICLFTGKLHYVFPDERVVLVDATLSCRFQKEMENDD